jgi:hypothetical protein
MHMTIVRARIIAITFVAGLAWSEGRVPDVQAGSGVGEAIGVGDDVLSPKKNGIVHRKSAAETAHVNSAASMEMTMPIAATPFTTPTANPASDQV